MGRKLINNRMKFPKHYKAQDGKYGIPRSEKTEENTMAKIAQKYIYYTAAPESYDGFGTKTIELTDLQDNTGKQIRKVEIPEAAYKWQTSRYSSGNYSYFTQKELEQYSEGDAPLFTRRSGSEADVLENEINTIKHKAPLDSIVIQNAELKDNSYIPQSRSCVSVDTVSPASMKYDMHKAIETIDRRVNGVDEYVAEKLGYIVSNCSMEQRKHGLQCLCDAFSAEQVDAIAVAIYNIEEKGQGCIIGDQTGIGKGRIAAAMIRYGMNRGMKPIFMTEKPNLFSDLFRDIINIGSDDGIPIEILEGYKLVSRKRKVEETEDEETDTDSETEDEEEPEFVNTAVYVKNKQYPSFTFQKKDELGIEHTITKKGKIFMRPFIINGEGTKTNIKDEQGNIIYKGNNKELLSVIGKYEKSKEPIGTTKGGKPKYAMVESQGSFEIPDDYKFVLCTYSQFRGATPTLKMKFLKAIAKGNIVVMDESHNASGASNVGAFLRESLEESAGVTFLSATFAKRPDNMPIYAAKTAMSDANMTSEELVEAIQRGGVALQEIVASNLTGEGQMIRRERSFEGIETNYEYLDSTQSDRGYPNLDLEQKHRVIMDAATDIIRDIMNFQRDFVNPEIEEMDRIKKAEYAEVETTKGTAMGGVDNTPIFSGIFNIINQLLFSIKAEAVAEVAIQRLKEGKKPVIAFANTMESFLNTMTNDEGFAVAENDVVSSDFSKIFEKRIQGVMKYTERDADGNTEVKTIKLEETSPEFRAEYSRLMKKIRTTSIGICSSPIDTLIYTIEKAGFSTMEVTGRSRQLKLLADGMGQVKNRVKVGANDAFRMFNNNEVDCLLINQSGSTGASAHAIPTAKVPKNKVKQRVMIILQPELNINTEVQKRGRINRTGQILKPIYDYVISAIPAEKRLMMMLQKKLKSLDANTTSSQKQAVEAPDAVQADFLNKYGDEIVAEYLKENPLVNNQLGDPLKLADMKDDEKPNTENAAHRISGRVAILSVKDQENFYKEITQRYISLVEYLKQTDEYDLEVTNMNLDAETVERDIVIVGKGGESVFSRNSVLEKCTVKNLRKPYNKASLDDFIKAGLGNYTAKDLQNSIIDKHSRFSVAHLEDEIKEQEEYYENLIKNIVNEKQAAKADDLNYYIREREKHLISAKDEAIARIRKASDNKRDNIKRLLDFFYVGKVVAYPSVTYSVDKDYSRAVFVGFVINDDTKNPYAPSAIKLKFVIASSQRYVAVPASKHEIMDAIMSLTYSRIFPAEGERVLNNWDEIIKEKTQDRTIRYIVTGNILQAFGKPELKGSLVSYTTNTGGVKKGILLPETYSKLSAGGGRDDGMKITVPIVKALPVIKELSGGSTIKTNDMLSITNTHYGYYKVYTSITMKVGGKFFLDPVLKDMSNEGTFNKVSSQMEASYDADKLENLVQYLQDKFALSVELAPYQFDKIKDSIEDTEYTDEEKRGEEIVIEKLVSEDVQEEERRRAAAEFENEQALKEKQAADEAAKTAEREALELEKKKIELKKKFMHLTRLLLSHELKMARGGNITSDEADRIKLEAYEIGRRSFKDNKSRVPAQNIDIYNFMFTDQNSKKVPAVELMEHFLKGFDFEHEIEMREMFPDFYANR